MRVRPRTRSRKAGLLTRGLERVAHFAGRFQAAMASARALGWGGTYHEAARRDAATADWRARLASADQAILDELDVMMARSRLAVANDPFAGSSQGAFRRHVVGGGITARSAARDPDSGEMLLDFNKGLDRAWKRYFWTPALCDAEQTKSLAEKQQLWMNELFAAGGVFVVESYVPQRGGVGLVLQEVEYEQRDQGVLEFEGRAVRGGVEVGEQGQPLAYHLFTATHPLEEFATRSTRIPAERCQHVFRQDRVLQRLGAPWTRPVLLKMRNLAMYDQYTMVQARTRAAFPMFIKQATGGPGSLPAVVARQLGVAPPAAGSGEPESELHVNLTPGIIPVLKAGQEIHAPAPGVPDTMYPPFVVEQLKGIAAGTGLDLATVARWYADGNFSSQRMAKLEMWAEIDWIQDLLFIHKILATVRRRFIELAVRERRVVAPRFFTSEEWREAYETTNWQGPPRTSADPVDDMAAWKLGFGLGICTPQEYCNQQGKDVREVLAELKEFRDLAEQAGVLDMLLPVWRGTDPQEPRLGRPRPEPGKQAADFFAHRQGRLLAGLLQGRRSGGNGPEREE
jgi:lambda family phage portal protein